MHVIGTAGHVDHGKSTLVETLTGIDPDRLAEEKRREMTIDLGFAWLTLDGEEVGIVDVPGHRDFIENMLAGVGGIDLALLVIAADEGVMAQTREHLAILELLQVPRAIVALTKTDLVGDDWLELVQLEVDDFLSATSLAGAPIIPVSANTGTGIEQLKACLSDALGKVDEAVDYGRPRLPIDRVFTLPGFGVIVTGTLIGGRLRIGDEIEIQPGSLVGRVRGLQTHKTKRDVAQPGSRVAVNVTGIDRAQLRRGQVLAAPVTLRPTQLLDVQYRHHPSAAAALRHNAQVKLFSGTAEVAARARIIGREQLGPGEEGWLQLALQEPLAAVRGDRFILRLPSPAATIGGGRVLDPHPGRQHRRFRPESAARFELLAGDDEEELLLARLAKLVSAARDTLAVGEDAEVVRRLIDEGRIIELGKTIVPARLWHELLDKVPRELAAYHKEAPLKQGMDRELLRGRLGIPRGLFDSLCENLVADGRAVEIRTTLKLPEHEIRFSSQQAAAVERLMIMLDKRGVAAPGADECRKIVGDDVYFALVELGRIVPVGSEVVYMAEQYERHLEQLKSFLRREGSISVGQARDLLGTSRKYALALLEHMDDLRLTRREGDVRVFARPPERNQ